MSGTGCSSVPSNSTRRPLAVALLRRRTCSRCLTRCQKRRTHPGRSPRRPCPPRRPNQAGPANTQKVREGGQEEWLVPSLPLVGQGPSKGGRRLPVSQTVSTPAPAPGDMYLLAVYLIVVYLVVKYVWSRDLLDVHQLVKLLRVFVPFVNSDYNVLDSQCGGHSGVGN